MKVMLKKFLKIEESQNFINTFCKKYNVNKVTVIPLANVGFSGIVYFVSLEYS